MSYENSYFPNRVICSVLEEIRKCHETRNYSYLPGLIEEAQSLANRMEAGLADKKDLIAMQKERGNLKAEIKLLRKEKHALKKELKKPEDPPRKRVTTLDELFGPESGAV